PHFVDLFEPAAQPAVLHPLFRCCGVAGAGHADLHTLECSISIQPSKPAGKVPPTLPSERFVNDGRTANVGRAPRLAFGLRVRARKLRGNEIIGWTGAPLRAVRGRPATSDLYLWEAAFLSSLLFTCPPLSASIHVSDMGRDGGKNAADSWAAQREAGRNSQTAEWPRRGSAAGRRQSLSADHAHQDRRESVLGVPI